MVSEVRWGAGGGPPWCRHHHLPNPGNSFIQVCWFFSFAGARASRGSAPGRVLVCDAPAQLVFALTCPVRFDGGL